MASERIASADFVRVWQRSSSTAEVAKHFDITPAHVRIRAATLRKHGVPLKQFAARGRKLDYAALAELARSLVADDQNAQQPQSEA